MPVRRNREASACSIVGIRDDAVLGLVCGTQRRDSKVPFSLAFIFGCDLFETESEIAKVKWRTPGKRLLDRIFDLAIIGGGINGCGIARDAAGRGNSVFLCEMNDLASGTSSWSTKLVHGGLRYLEYYEFRLVREALIEREILWQIAPHIIRPLRFVLPHHAGLRPAWLLRLGLFLYDHIGGRHLLPPTRSVDLTSDEVGKPLVPNRFTAASNIPIVSSTTRVWWCSPRAMPPIAAPTSAPARARSISARPTASGTSPSKTR